MKPIQIAPSVLPVDFSRLGDAVCELDQAGVDLIQWDVMDGQFVPNLTFGPDIIASTRSLTKLPFEAHLMVLTPEAMASRYVEAGCSRLIVHAEACANLRDTLETINKLGATSAVALNPETDANEVSNILDLVDLILVMTVRPGFGGQKYIQTMETKIAQVRKMISDANLDDKVNIEVDGGISVDTVSGAAKSGANVLVAGSALFKDPKGLTHAVQQIRETATNAFNSR